MYFRLKMVIFYFSDIRPPGVGNPLLIDDEDTWINPQIDGQVFQSLDELTGSLSKEAFNNIFSGSSYDYSNLYVDFNEFSNHTFFGSAKQKLINFKEKVKTIQSYYTDNSSSLSITGVDLDGD